MSITQTVLPEGNKAFTTGELVKLKSGGPVMTVIFNTKGNLYGVKCIWYNKATDAYNTQEFAEETLEKASKEK